MSQALTEEEKRWLAEVEERRLVEQRVYREGFNYPLRQAQALERIAAALERMIVMAEADS